MTTERSFKKTMTKIGIVMIVFLVLLNALVFIHSFLTSFLYERLPERSAYIFSELFYAFIYLASFIIPGLLLISITRKEKAPLMLEKKVPPARETAAYIVASVALILGMAILNSKLISVFDFSGYSDALTAENVPIEPFQLVLSFLLTAIVPAVCEEFLFRGAILSALKPYGKAPAIIISAVLFGIMHQNAAQLLYTTAAGLILAFVVYETGSIWCAILIHFYNNFLNVFETSIFEMLPQNIAYPIIYALEGLVFVFGIIAFAYLAVKLSRRREAKLSPLSDGFYGKSLAEINCDYELAQKPLSFQKAAKHFFSPTIIIFIVLSAIAMALNILLNILYGFFIGVVGI